MRLKQEEASHLKESQVGYLKELLPRKINIAKRMYTRAVQRKMSFFNTAYFFPPETDFEYVP